jgi:hypothetical protein
MAGRAEAKSQVNFFFLKKKGARPGTCAMDTAGTDLRTLRIQDYGRCTLRTVVIVYEDPYIYTYYC